MSVPRDPTGKLLFAFGGYCALCRETLPEPNSEIGFVPPLSDAWQYKVIGLYNIASTDKPSRIVAAFGDLANAVCFEEIAVDFASGQFLVLKVEITHQIRNKDRIAHLVHLPCWKLIKALDSDLSLRSIYEFAESTYSLFKTSHVPEGQDITATGFTGFIDENASQSNLGKFLNRISRLPLELQLAISEACPSNLISSLVTVARTSFTLVSAFKCSQSQRHIELICHSDVKTLSATTVSIFGNKYISSLRFNELSEGSEKVQVKESEVTGIKFAIGRYGLKALRICYASNESSDWLGDPRAGWIGVMRGTDITSLRILRDDLKCIRVDFMHGSPMREQRGLLLDKDISFRFGDHHRILDTRDSSRIKSFPKWRMCRYLPFFDETGYISSLTMYCSGHSITGMAAGSGLSLRSIGECSDKRHPVHIYLQPGERIESIWLRMPNPHSDTWHRPNIMVLTNLNRTQIFGPTLIPGSGFYGDERYQWTLLNKSPGYRPTGIFFDALRRDSASQRIDNIGITQRARLEVQGIYPMVPKLTLELYTDAPGKSFVNCYLTVASFAHVKELRVSRIGSQISGMAIHHHDGSIDVLGKWGRLSLDFPSKIEQIYHYKDGTLTSIAFGFSGGENGPKLVDAIFLAIDHKPRIKDVVPQSKIVVEFQVAEADPPTVMWLFNLAHDHVDLWNGEYLPPNIYKSTHEYRITEFEIKAVG